MRTKDQNNKQDNMSLRERIALSLRGWRLIIKYCGSINYRYLLLYVLQALRPYVNVWVSALILSELTGLRRPVRLSVYAALIVGLNFLMQAGIKLLDYSGYSYGYAESFMMFNGYQKMFADKQMDMDYVDIEDARIQRQYKQVKENLFFYGNGLGQLFWSLRQFVSGLTSVIASISLSVTLFFSGNGGSVLDSPLWVLPMIGLLLLSAFFIGKNEEKSEEIFREYSSKSSWMDRTMDFFGWTLYSDLPRAKDVRLYRQNVTADHVLAGMQQADREISSPISRRLSLRASLSSLVSGGCYTVIYLFVVLKALAGAFDIGSVVRYVGALSLLAEGVRNLMSFFAQNRIYTYHLKELYAYLDIPNKKYEGTLPVEQRDDDAYEMEFRNVSFRYPGTETYALRDVSLKFHMGERMAVVGMNGSGKTTFIKLLCRLYDPDEGEILLNGTDIRQYKYDEYLSLFSVVFQDFQLFSFPLGQNVAASVEVSGERARDCLDRAGLNERMDGMKDGLDTCLYKDFDENGVEVSGGEAQKIALARALYKNAPFLVLDEPTAALDPIAECEVYTRFDETIGNKTAVYISHRLASCRFCDDIAVFHEGRIVQRGRHEQLLEDENGKYFELWNAQAQYYTAPHT